MSVETSDYSKMLGRMVRAYGRRVAEADEIELAEMIGVLAELEAALAVAVAGQREGGRSWAEIAVGLGTTRQAAQQRFGSRIMAETA